MSSVYEQSLQNSLLEHTVSKTWHENPAQCILGRLGSKDCPGRDALNFDWLGLPKWNAVRPSPPKLPRKKVNSVLTRRDACRRGDGRAINERNLSVESPPKTLTECPCETSTNIVFSAISSISFFYLGPCMAGKQRNSSPKNLLILICHIREKLKNVHMKM